jgi:hypothetical protein
MVLKYKAGGKFVLPPALFPGMNYPDAEHRGILLIKVT